MKLAKSSIKKIVIWSILSVFGLVTGCSSIFVVDEGHVGIVKRLGKAEYQQNPGVHMKMPFIDSVVSIEVRTRKNEEKMTSSTAEQMPVTVSTSVNWTVSKEAAIDLYRKYGGLDQFENRILDPRFRAAAKSAIPKYEAEKLIQDRTKTIADIEELLAEEMKLFPVTIDNVQIENIVLPAKYIQSIETKQTEKNLAAAEQHKLDRQKLEAMQKVNTADANAQSIKLEAEARAEAMRVEGEAEAYAITEKAKALKNNPLIVELTKAQKWNGQVPSTVLGDSQNVLYSLK